MKKYDHPLLQEVDYSQAKEPAMEMLLALQQQADSLNLNAYLDRPFELPFFDEAVEIYLDEANERFEFVRADGKLLSNFALAKQAAKTYPPGNPDSDLFVITMADPTSGLVGGYWLGALFPFLLVFDRLLWEACGQPLDGRGFRLDCSDCLWRPVVMGMGDTFLLSDGRPIKKMAPYFPDQQTAEKLGTDFSLRSICPRECQPVSPFDLRTVEAVRKQPGWEEFSFADWQKAQADMKEQLKGSSTETLLQMPDTIPLRAWGYLNENGELQLGVLTPGQGWQESPAYGSWFAPLNILYEYVHARPKSDFYLSRSKETLLTAIEIICAHLGIRRKLKLKDVPYLSKWRSGFNPWLGGGFFRLAQMLVDHRLEPLWSMDMDRPNAHLLRDAEIDQWLPADFQITEQNQKGFLAFVHGVLYDLRDLTVEQTAEYFQQCLCSPQAQQVEFETMDGKIQLLDLMAGGYFDRGRCSFSWGSCSSLMENHARCRYDSSLCWSYWPDAPLPFSWKKQVVLEGFVFQMPKSAEEYGHAFLYCGWRKRGSFPLASDRIPPVMVSLADSPRVPIGVVEPLSADFVLSDEFYQTLSEPKEQFDEQFKQIVEQYWEIFDKKYPYLY